MYKWCQFNPKYDIKDSFYGKILNFYLWQCPVEKTAYTAPTFKELGWSSGYQFKKLKKTIINLPDSPIPYLVVDKSNLQNTLVEYKQFNSYVFEEVIIFTKTGEGEMVTLLRSIRNAFAHGSFMVRKKRSTNAYYYFFESRNPSGDLQARLILKSSTLVSMIKIISSGFHSL